MSNKSQNTVRFWKEIKNEDYFHSLVFYFCHPTLKESSKKLLNYNEEGYLLFSTRLYLNYSNFCGFQAAKNTW